MSQVSIAPSGAFAGVSTKRATSHKRAESRVVADLLKFAVRRTRTRFVGVRIQGERLLNAKRNETSSMRVSPRADNGAVIARATYRVANSEGSVSKV